MKCLLISRFNVTNIGDLAISHKLYEISSEYFSVDKYNLFGKPNQFTNIDSIEANSYSIKYKLHDLLNRKHFKWALKLYEKTKRKMKNTLPKSATEFENIVHDYDLIIIGGGNMIMELSEGFKSITRFERYVNYSIDIEKPVFVMDIGIGPFKTQNQVAKAVEVLNKCNYITFRDKSSYNLFIENGGDESKAFVSVDPVFLLNHEVAEQPKTNSKNHVGLNIFNSKEIGYGNDQYIESVKAYAQLIDDLVEKENMNVSIFITSKEDQAAIDDVYKFLRNKKNTKKMKINGIKDLLDFYSSIDILIGTRMHSMIIAYTMKIPLIGLSWQKKVTSFFEIIGQEKYLFKFENLNHDGDKIVASCNKRIETLSEDKKSIENQLNVIRERASIDRKILSFYSKKNKHNEDYSTAQRNQRFSN